MKRRLKIEKKNSHTIDLCLIRIHLTLRVGLNYTAIIACLICNYSPRCEMWYPLRRQKAWEIQRCQLKAQQIFVEKEIWSGEHRAAMLSPWMAACIAFPLGYTCQSGAKLSVRRPSPWEVPNVCAYLWRSAPATWDKGRKAHTSEGAKMQQQHSQLMLLLIRFNSPFACVSAFFLSQWSSGQSCHRVGKKKNHCHLGLSQPCSYGWKVVIKIVCGVSRAQREGGGIWIQETGGERQEEENDRDFLPKEKGLNHGEKKKNTG